MSKISPARLAAYDILRRIEVERAYSSALLPAYEKNLTAADRGLCHELVLGVLRRQIYLDRVIAAFAGSKKLDVEIRIALRLGLHQLLFLDKIPAYSAINESVNLVQKAKKTSAKGFVNAILRRASKERPEFAFADDIERISVETSHPRWLIEKWIDDFGATDAEALAVANNSVPRVAFRFNAAASGDLPDIEKSSIVDGAFVAGGVTESMRTMAEAGEIYFQDEGSQLVGQVAASLAGNRFLDVCAAPGGKTTLVAGILPNALVVAGDVHSSRVRLLQSTCRRQNLESVQIVQYDAERAIPFADGSFDTVLIDAPCSGTGTIRHNPEIRYSLQSTDFSELANKQRSLLRNASKLVQPGGRLIYSTCSLQIEENEDVCRAVMSESEEFSRLTPDVADRFITPDGFARTFPHRDGVDGFFVAVYERNRAS